MSITHGIEFRSVNGDIAKHSDTDFGLILTNQDIGTPTPKTHTVAISGRDGEIDLTEAFGEVKFGNRAIKLTFVCIEGLESWEARKTQVANFLHGQKMKITTWSDSGYYYLGRCTVDEYSSSKSQGTIVISCDCEPYKYKHELTTFNLVSGTNAVNNSRMTIFADLNCTEEVTINDTVYSAGDYLKAIKLTYGTNTLTSSGNATLTYREGDL